MRYGMGERADDSRRLHMIAAAAPLAWTRTSIEWHQSYTFSASIAPNACGASLPSFCTSRVRTYEPVALPYSSCVRELGILIMTSSSTDLLRPWGGNLRFDLGHC
jgi:hypothetical protein